jgi:hypothetical protein
LKAYDLQIEDIIKQNRLQKVAEARMVVAYCLRLLENLSFPAIGKILGDRDHTTMMHSCKKIADKIEHDNKFRFRMKLVLDSIRALEPGLAQSMITGYAEEERSNADLALPQVEEVIEKLRSNYTIPQNVDLTQREKSLLEAYRKGSTLKQIADELNLTRERVRQLIKKALLKEVGKKINDGFEMDIEEVLNSEKIANQRARNIIPTEKKEKMLTDFLVKANSYTSVNDFAHDVHLSSSKLTQQFPEVVEIIEKKSREKKARWSTAYIHCRKCKTTIIPHVKKGYCEKCVGMYRGERREAILNEKPMCAVCGIERKKAIQKFKKDLYITQDGRILCRGCFAQLTGSRMVESRWGKL